MKFPSTIVLLFLVLNLFSQDCIYLAYESFDAPEQNLEGIHSGQTFQSAWQVQNEDNATGGYRIISNAPLQYSDVQTVGNYVTGGYEYLTAGRNLHISSTGFFGPYLNENEQIGATGTDLWVSVMLRKEAGNDQPVWLSLHNSAVPWCNDCASSSIGLGYFGESSNQGNQQFWSLSVNGVIYRSSEVIGMGETAFLAAHITFGAETTVDFFVNPTETGFQTILPSLSATTSTLVEFQSMALFLGNTEDNGAADEIRIGTSWACVSPDSEVSVNLPPTAQIDLLPASGMVPLMVEHNGNNSTDPDGQVDHYEWLLPDESSINAASFSSDYTTPGELAISLRVTDEHGAQNTTYATITVLDENGSFPCLSSLTLLQKAHCETQSGGNLRINTEFDANITLQAADGQEISPTNWQQYDELAPGDYSLLVAGDNACSDEYQIVIPVDSSSCTGWEALTCFEQMGMNLTGFADWEKERPMRNLFKHIRRDLPTFTDDCDCWDLNISNELVYDENGYPTHIPQNTSAGATKIRLVLSANVSGAEAGNLQGERTYVLLYDGQVEMNLFGVQIDNESPGRIEFTTPTEGTLDNVIIDVHQSPANDYLRNIRLLRIEDELADLNAQPFYEGFLEKIAPFTCLRFMDWGSTNGNPIQSWEDRTPVDFRTYGREEGAPYEMMIALANQTQKDVWICVPHLADEEYVQQMARLFRDQLDENLTIYLEYSNEVWNWIFPQAQYNLQTAPANLNYGRAYAEKAKTTFEFWHEEFGNQKDRVQRVLGLQLTFNWLNEQILSQLDQEDWDYASPTWYFGLDNHPALGESTTPSEIINIAEEVFISSMPTRRQDYRNVQLYGKSVIEYEGGQHFTDLQHTPWSEAIMAAQELPEIYDLYQSVFDSLQLLGSAMPVAFSLSREVNNIFNFGHMDDIDTPEPYLETAPKYQALLDNICPMITATAEPTTSPDAPLLSIFPNPIKLGSTLFVQSAQNLSVLHIYNSSGQLIKTQSVDSSTTAVKIDIDRNWPSGIYAIAFISQDGSRQVQKVVVID